MATKKPAIKSVHSKKELKKDLTVKIEPVLTELKSTLGEKEFQHRVKKAIKIFVQGLHNKDFAASGNGTNGNVAQASSPKIKNSRKAKPKTQKKSAKLEPVSNT